MLPPAALEVTRHNLLQFVATGCRTTGRTLLKRGRRYAPTNSSNTARNHVAIETQIPEDRSCLRDLGRSFADAGGGQAGRFEAGSDRRPVCRIAGDKAFKILAPAAAGV